MIYCPSCKKPSAKNTGSCPHCGYSFGGAAAKVKLSSQRQAENTSPANSRRFDGGDVELDDGVDESNAPLELAIDDGNDVAPSRHLQPAQRQSASNDAGNDSFRSRAMSISEIDTESKIAHIAQFGQCENGIVGTMKYGLRVYQRLPRLQSETDTVRIEKDQSWASLETAKAKLGQFAFRNGIRDGRLERLISRAAKADSKLADVQQEEDSLTGKYEQQFKAQDNAIAAVKKEMAPYAEEEQKTRNQFDQMTKERARLSAKIKRTEIELRNVRELIEKKQMAYADLKRPQEERAVLLREIAEVDNRQPPLMKRLSQEQKELADTSAPFDTVSAQLQQIGIALDQYKQKLAQIQKSRGALETEYQNALNAIHNKAEGESKQAQEAWASVGEIVYVNKLAPPAALEDVANNAKNFFAVQEKLGLYENALNSYNKAAFEQAKKYWIAAAVAAGVLLLSLMAAIIF